MIKLYMSSKERFREEKFTEEIHRNHLWLSKSLNHKLLQTGRLLRKVSPYTCPVLMFFPRFLAVAKVLG